jgi:hypothetical protein
MKKSSLGLEISQIIATTQKAVLLVSAFSFAKIFKRFIMNENTNKQK